MSDSLAAMIRSYLDDTEIALNPADPAAEARTNTWHYGISGDIDVATVVEAFDLVQSELRRRFLEQVGSATFYAWYDDQAGQLRCSLTSARPDRLPFRAPYRLTTDVSDIVREAATDPHPGTIAWGELTPIDTASNLGVVAEMSHPPFRVWAVAIN
jgi:hypothetical protein